MDGAATPLLSGHVEERDHFADASRVASQQRYCSLIFKPEGGLIDGYLGGHQGIALVRFKVHAGRQVIQDGFILQSHKMRLATTSSDVYGRREWIDLQEPVVLSYYVEAIEPIQYFISSVVSRASLDTVSLTLGKSPFVFNFLHISEERGLVGMNREVSMPVRCYAVALGQSGHQDVKPAADGVDHRSNVAKDQRIKRFVGISDNELPAARIRLCDNSVRLSLLPQVEPLNECWCVGNGPIH